MARIRFQKEITNKLNCFFDKNDKPKAEELEKLSKQLNLDIETIRTWFQNKRMKIKAQSKLSQMPLFNRPGKNKDHNGVLVW